MNTNWTNAGRTVADLGTITTVDINGGNIDGAVIGAAAAVAGTFGALVATASLSSSAGITGSSLVIGAAGTTGASISNNGYLSFVGMADNWTNAGRTIADLGIATTVDIRGGAIDGTTIGANNQSSGKFTTLSGSSTLRIAGIATFGNHIIPLADNAKDLGAADKRWRNIYTGDLHLKNERGDWTMIEEEDCLTIRNNKTGKRFKLLMEEID